MSKRNQDTAINFANWLAKNGLTASRDTFEQFATAQKVPRELVSCTEVLDLVAKMPTRASAPDLEVQSLSPEDEEATLQHLILLCASAVTEYAREVEKIRTDNAKLSPSARMTPAAMRQAVAAVPSVPLRALRIVHVVGRPVNAPTHGNLPIIRSRRFGEIWKKEIGGMPPDVSEWLKAIAAIRQEPLGEGSRAAA